VSRPTGTHTQAVRCLQLIRELERQPGVHWLEDIAKRLHVDERTIRRDINALRAAGERVWFKNGGAWVEQ
jgi:predicted DNA-binding transcriptional regulator YafY